MEEPATENCPNCKRPIPAANFTVHSAHCVRNLRLCDVCKEPVPITELSSHHQRLHELMACEQCGEDVRGSDLEDHVRDSCAHTDTACHYCRLILPRRDLTPHEIYCGARTERCECGELVMLKYQQIHQQTQHGFVKLDDEPGPEPSWKKYEKKQTKSTNTTNQGASTSRVNGSNEQPIAADLSSPPDVIGRERVPNLNQPTSSQVELPALNINNELGGQGVRTTLKRTNDMPQLNTNVESGSKVDKERLNKDATASGSVRREKKKRPAPPPPGPASGPTAPSDPAAPSAPAVPAPDVTLPNAAQRGARGAGEPMSAAQFEERLLVRLGAMRVRPGDIRQELRALRHSLSQVTAPYSSNQNRSPTSPPAPPITPGAHPQFRLLDFMYPPPVISWRVVRRSRPRVGEGSSGGSNVEGGSSGLNSDGGGGEMELGSPSSDDSGVRRGEGANDSRLPCEFCGTMVAVENLIQHETGCRPDLTRLRSPPNDNDAPVIPCEFCARPYPVYQLMHHQQNCQHR